MKNLEKKLLEICDKERALVAKPPENEQERGFQLATLRMCALIRKEIISYKLDLERSAYSKEEFIHLLERLEEEHKE